MLYAHRVFVINSLVGDSHRINYSYYYPVWEMIGGIVFLFRRVLGCYYFPCPRVTGVECSYPGIPASNASDHSLGKQIITKPEKRVIIHTVDVHAVTARYWY